MCHIVANKHSGSLKGEHGTGRNVAPFVEMEWGTKAYDLMWELKSMFDPNFVLNPGECHHCILAPLGLQQCGQAVARSPAGSMAERGRACHRAMAIAVPC